MPRFWCARFPSRKEGNHEKDDTRDADADADADRDERQREALR